MGVTDDVTCIHALEADLQAALELLMGTEWLIITTAHVCIVLVSALHVQHLWYGRDVILKYDKAAQWYNQINMSDILEDKSLIFSARAMAEF